MVDANPVGDFGGESSRVARFIPGSTYGAGGNAVLLTVDRVVVTPRVAMLQVVAVAL